MAYLETEEESNQVLEDPNSEMITGPKDTWKSHEEHVRVGTRIVTL